MNQDRRYDLLILGGGTVGIACLLDATLRGLKTAVIERRHIGRQTNAASLGLLQGGFKYIATNTDLITADSIDCGLLKRLVPHLIRRQPILIPILEKSKFPPWLWERLFRAYDQYAHLREVEKHRQLSPAEVEKEEPIIKHKTKGGMLFYEWAVDPTELTQTIANTAIKLGGIIYEGCEAIDFHRISTVSGERIVKVLIKKSNWETFWIWGTYFINATGPWAPHLPKLLNLKPFEARPTKGTSIIVNKRLTRNGVITFNKYGKYIMLLPYKEASTLIGPTNIDVDENVRINPDLLQPTELEKQELLGIGSEITGEKLTLGDIIETKCGLRPQLNHLGVKPDQITHDFIVGDHFKRDGIINLGYLYGGKLSNQIRMAKEGIDLACHRMQSFGKWQNIKDWSVPQLLIKPNGRSSVLTHHQDCQITALRNRKYGLTLDDTAGRVAMRKKTVALLKLLPFIFGKR